MKRQSGVSLVELMIAITIGLFLMAVLVQLIGHSSAQHRELALANQQIENGRYAMQVLTDDLHDSGFFGTFLDLGDPTTLPLPCSTTPSDYETSLAPGAYFLNSPATASVPLCVGSANYVAGTDILMIVRASSAPTALAALADGDIYVQTDTQTLKVKTASAASNATEFNLMKRSAAPPPPAPPILALCVDLATQPECRADIRKLQVHIYFVSPCNRFASGVANCTPAADDGNPVPTLKRVELTPGGFSAPIAVAEGIDNMQIEFGLDSSVLNPADPPDGSPDSFIASTPTLAQLKDTVAVGVYLLARNPELSAGYTDTKLYVLGSDPATSTIPAANDNFKRHAYSRVIRLYNASGRREP